MQTSLTGVGAIAVTVLNLVLPALGFEVQGDVESFVMGATNVLAFATLIYGQWRRKDVKGFVFKQ